MGGGLEVEEWEGRGWVGGVEVEVEMEGLKGFHSGSAHHRLARGSFFLQKLAHFLPLSNFCHKLPTQNRNPWPPCQHPGCDYNVQNVFFYLVKHP